MISRPKPFFISLLSILFISLFTTSLIADDLVLSGRQKQKVRTINLSENEVSISYSYTVPKNHTLIFEGAGSIKSNSDRVSKLIIEGTLKMGTKRLKKIKGKLSTPPKISFADYKTTIMLIDQSSRAFVQNAQLHQSKWSIDKGKSQFISCFFTGEETKFKALTDFPGQILFKKCMFSKGRYDFRPHPENISKAIQFNACVFKEFCELNLNTLWSMIRCDIHGESIPNEIKTSWKSIPKFVPSVHFSNKEHLRILHHTIKKSFPKFKIKHSRKPLNQKLNFNENP